MRQPIKGKDGWFKDTTTGGIDLGDTNKYEKYMKSYHAEKRKEDEFKALQNDVSGLKSELDDIKSLLLTLVNQNNHDN